MLEGERGEEEEERFIYIIKRTNKLYVLYTYLITPKGDHRARGRQACGVILAAAYLNDTLTKQRFHEHGCPQLGLGSIRGHLAVCV